MAFSKLKQRWKKSELRETLVKIKSGSRNIFYSVIFDACFVFIAYLFGFVFNTLLPAVYSSKITSRVAYLFLLIALYSVFKMLVLHATKNVVVDGKTGKEKEGKGGIRQAANLFLLNILVFAFFLVFGVIANFILVLLPGKASVITAGIVISLLLFLFFYPLLNLSHSCFMLGKNVWKSFGEGIKRVFSSFKKYGNVFTVFIVGATVLWVLYTLLDLILRNAVKQEVLISFYPNLVKILAILGLVVMYVLHIYNRVYFMNVIQRLK